ncbi:MAG: Ni/Fe hydrogenase subunit gamma [Deinococcus-Thermus bacterium]|jgi:NAD(P)H-flavin reductase|nr:Ni/Fe hydrogenase subunit gamma [Deinococcota bacterium]
MRPHLHTVRAVRQDLRDTFTLELAPRTQADRTRPFGPGQFSMLYVFGVGEVPISMSGDPARPDVLVHTTREVGAVTRAMGALKAGDTIGVRGPFGTTWPVDEAEGGDVVLVAGGIGLAPLRPAIYHLLNHRDRYRRIVILFGARTPEELLYEDEVSAWRSHLDLEVHVSVDRATGDWRGNVGFVTSLIPRAPFDPKRTVAMACGPEIMMTNAAKALAKRGVPKERTWLSLERNMKCAIGHCGHCQMGPLFVCHDGPVFRYDEIAPLMAVPEV